MAVQPVHLTREQLLVEGLGERVPIETSGHFTLYARSKTTHELFIHDKRNGPVSLPAGWVTRQFFDWSTHHRGETFSATDPLDAFRWWVEQQ